MNTTNSEPAASQKRPRSKVLHLPRGVRLWAFGVLFVLTVHFTGDTVLEAVEALWHREPTTLSAGLLLTLASLGGFVVAWGVLAAFEPNPIEGSRWREVGFLNTSLVFLVGISAIGTGVGLHGAAGLLVGRRHPLGLSISLVYFVVFIGASLGVWWRYKDRPLHLWLREAGATIAVKSRIEKRKVLIAFLSTIGDPPSWFSPTGNLTEDINCLRRKKIDRPNDRTVMWSGEPLLAAIDTHRPELKHVVIVASGDRKEEIDGHEHLVVGSLRLVPTLLRVLDRYATDLKGVEFWIVVRRPGETRFSILNSVPWNPTDTADYSGVDFEDFGKLVEVMREVLRTVPSLWSLNDTDITIDMTGGQKPTTVVAAVSSFNRRIQAQYVQTNPHWNVLTYDIVLDEKPPSGM